jgi:sec-independent protein translocase protein TatC
VSVEMTFWDHLDELRRVLFRSVIAIFIIAVPVFLCKEILFGDIIFAPAKNDFILYKWLGGTFPEEFSLELINIDLSAQFFIHISVSFTIAFILAVPFILYQFWSFIKPGLYTNEQKATKKAFLFGAFLFLIGVIVGYLFVFPM